jgi:hypothetical protein
LCLLPKLFENRFSIPDALAWLEMRWEWAIARYIS